MLRPDHRKLAERILTAHKISKFNEDNDIDGPLAELGLAEPLKDTQIGFVVNILHTNEEITDRQEVYLKWLYNRKVEGNKGYYSDILRSKGSVSPSN